MNHRSAASSKATESVRVSIHDDTDDDFHDDHDQRSLTVLMMSVNVHIMNDMMLKIVLLMPKTMIYPK